MQITNQKLNEGSLLIRIYSDDVDVSQYPPYLIDVVLSPINDNTAELLGLDDDLKMYGNRFSIVKTVLKYCNTLGYPNILIKRSKNGQLIEKYYNHNENNNK